MSDTVEKTMEDILTKVEEEKTQDLDPKDVVNEVILTKIEEEKPQDLDPKDVVNEVILTKVEEEKTQDLDPKDVFKADVVKEVILTEVMIDITRITFSQMLENFLNQNKDKLESLSIKLTPEIQTYLLILLKDKSSFFNDIDSSLKKIILDDKIDLKDIPEIIVLVTKVYKIINTDKGIPKVDPYELIKNILHIVFTLYIETNKVQNNELATDLLKIIDVSIDLIKLKAIKPPKIGCLSKLFWYFYIM
jgi:hypothetical protein